MAAVTERDLARYFEAREEERQHEIAEAYPALERQMARFLEVFADDENLPAYVARMIWETAVAAYVRGRMHASGIGTPPPKDSVMFFETLETVRAHDDLYPAWRVFDGRHNEEEGDV